MPVGLLAELELRAAEREEASAAENRRSVEVDVPNFARWKKSPEVGYEKNCRALKFMYRRGPLEGPAW